MIEAGQGEVGFAGDEPAGGELLAERLAQGPLPPEVALRYSIEIGAALNRAHLRGLVHGGLSPFSVRIASTGARILPPLGEYDERAAPYRSPEQVRGEMPDWPSDVFAYGALLYEMASGRRAFPGEGAELNDAILEQPVAGLMAKSPIHAAMEGVIAGCLEKDPARRRRIQNAVIELKPADRSWQRMAEVPNQLPRRPAGIGTAAAPALIAVAALSAAAAVYLHQRPAAPFLRFAMSPPEYTGYPGTPSVSPDGRFLTFSALGPEAERMLWLRPLDALHANVIPGTEDGFAPF